MVLSSFLQSLTALPTATDDASSSYAQLALIAAAAAVLTAAMFHLSRSDAQRANRLGRPAAESPTALPLLGSTADLVKNVDRFHHWMTDQCLLFDGRPWVMRALGRPDVIVVSSVQAVEDVTSAQASNFVRGEYAYEILRDLLGDGVITLDGEAWALHRKVAAQLFTARALRDSLLATVHKYTRVLRDVFADAARDGDRLDLFALLGQFTMEAFAEMGFGVELDCLRSRKQHAFQRAFDGAQEVMTARLMAPDWLWRLQRKLGVGLEGKLPQWLRGLDAIVLDMISKSIVMHTSGEKRQDLISLFLDHLAADNSSSDVPDAKYLRDMAMQFLLAGRDTTAQTLSWFFFALSEKPDVEQRIREEVRTQIPALLTDDDYSPSLEDTQTLVYTEAALREALRLYPSAPFNARDAVQDAVLSDGTFVPAGARVGLPLFGMARMPSIWGPDAAQFNPERWIDGATGKLVNVSEFQFLTFHAGPHRCLGRHLAMVEMKVAVAQLLARFHVRVVPGQTVTYQMSLALPMKNPFMVEIVPLEV